MPNNAIRKLSYPAYKVVVDYDLTVEQLITAGQYDWFNDDITSRNFPSKEKDVAAVLIYLVNFDYDISSEDVVRKLDRQGLRPATLKELLALGITQPDLQRSNPIFALGSVWRGSSDDVEVPHLYGLDDSRNLDLDWWSGDWPSDWRFAAVRK